MNQKIVFFDIDGTLLDEEKQIPDSTRKAVRQLQEAGIYTAIATGRTPAMFDWVREELGIHSYVSINGQYVVFEGEEIHSNPMSPDALGELVDAAGRNGHPVAFHNHDSIYVTEKDHPFIRSGYQSLLMEHPEWDAEFYKHSPVHQGILFCEEGQEQQYMEQYPHFSFIRWHPLAVDVLPQGCSKAMGIQQFLAKAGLRREHSYAFGDGLNDIEMLSFVGTGVAMGNAVPALKRQAKHVTTACDEDGIWNGLVALGLL
ncbi:Cof-type HAD-IIB family hydrolase [Ectobacillus ponti]|uniref:Cof-type HAD-IIB family hydrolase n=1 Tax=Ectobacillus ponti TaxID=2961894 RepID=A0AA42BNJ9_9BACI|nr:Cof-type HAD-IIB family hydrolase [Ectobacillus ponti]MCP8967737.1 Cof-type HAD-IIB family hydrolase [Ectobacillus ponti]